jgi:hypothetical protein
MYNMDYIKTRNKRAWEHESINQNGVFEKLGQIAKRLLKEEKQHIFEQLAREADEIIKTLTGDESKKANTVARPKVKLKTAKAGDGKGVSVNGQTAQKSKKVQQKTKAQK